MPDSTSGSDDPFADLFGKLPDPRLRGGDAPGPRRTPAADAVNENVGDAPAPDAPASTASTPVVAPPVAVAPEVTLVCPLMAVISTL